MGLWAPLASRLTVDLPGVRTSMRPSPGAALYVRRVWEVSGRMDWCMRFGSCNKARAGRTVRLSGRAA